MSFVCMRGSPKLTVVATTSAETPTECYTISLPFQLQIEIKMDRILKVLNFSLRNLGESIQAICRHVVKHYHDLHDWLFAVPLAHFLTQASKPFSTDVLLVEEPKRNDDLWWGASGFSTKPVREANFTDIR